MLTTSYIVKNNLEYMLYGIKINNFVRIDLCAFRTGCIFGDIKICCFVN